MKRLLLLLLAVVLTTLMPSRILAQDTLPDLLEDDEDNTTQADTADGPQRIGIPAASLELDPNESGAIAGYCFDEHLIAPTRLTTFQNVLAGNESAIVRTADGRSGSLREAIRRGDLAIRAHQLNVMFVNRTDGPMSVSLAQPTVLWDRPAGAVNPLALRALATPGLSFDARQKAVWKITNTERRLHALGYLPGSIYSYNPERLRAALNAFQRDHNMAATTDLDAQTAERVRGADEILRNRLRALGFESREGRFARENLGSQIRAYEKFLGVKPVGRWSAALASNLTTTESVIPQLKSLRPQRGQQIADVLGASNGDVLTFLGTSRGMMVLTNTPTGLELWTRTGRTFSVTDRGVEAIRTIDETAAAMAQRASRKGHVVIYAGVAESGVTTLTVGERVVDVDAAELALFVAGGAIPKALESMLSPMLPQSSSNRWTGASDAKTFVVYRSPLQQGRAAEALERNGLAQVDGGKLAGALDRVYGDRMTLYVTDDLRAGATRYDRSMGMREHPSARGIGLALAD